MMRTGEVTGMFFGWWRNHASIVGTAAQWFAGLASLGTLAVALYGLSKAVPFFENLNLREMNAQLHINNRKLAEEREKFEAQTAKAERDFKQQEVKTEYLLTLYQCTRISGGVFDVIKKSSDLTFKHLLLLGTAKPEDDPPHLLGPRVRLRAVIDVALDETKDRWWREQEERAIAAWRELARRNEEKLELVIFPGADGKLRPSRVQLEEAQRNAEVGWAFREEMDRLCTSLLPEIPK
jgi:hypothetical protein